MKKTSQFLSDLSSLGIKIWAEGDALRYQAPKGIITPDILSQLRDRKTDILSLLQISNNQVNLPISPISREQNIPLSFAQQRLWFIEQLEGKNTTYNISLALELEGNLNQYALSQALQIIVERHETLRTSFTAIDGNPVQTIAPYLEISLTVIDLVKSSKKEQETQINTLVEEEVNQPFDLTIAPLFRAKLLKRNNSSHILILTLHHIITDGWSMEILKHELSTFYQDALASKSSSLDPLIIQYIDFSHWQRNWLQGKVLEQQINYWKNQLTGLPPLLELPTDKLRPAIQTFTGKTKEIQLSSELSQQLKNFSQQSGVTLFMTLLAAFGVLLYRYSHQENIVIGSPIANRKRQEIESLIGFFANTLALNVNLQNNPSFRELLARVKEMCLNSYIYQDLPFEKLVEELQPERSLSYHPIFQTVFILQNTPPSTVNLMDLTITPFKVEKQTAKFDLTLSLFATKSGLDGVWEYNTDLFDAATIERMSGHFETLLKGILANAEQPISQLPLLTEVERHQLLFEVNETATNYPQDKCIQQLFEEQVERTPDAVAIVFQEEKLTYRELNCRANQLAHYLQKLGVKPEVLVGICLERSPLMIVALLAILKAGGVYVPLDPDYPQERLIFMLEDTQIPVLLTQDSLVEKLPTNQAQILCLETDWEKINCQKKDNPTCNATADNLAYIIYTSGSTGKPKGVCAIHRGVVRLVKGIDYANLSSAETLLQLAPISFDASTFEIWGSLLNGARLALFPSHPPSLEELGQAIRRYQVTTLWLTAGLFHLMVDERLEDLKPLRQLLAGGDVLSVSHVQKFLQAQGKCQLINGYGPTENTTFTCCYRILETSKLDNSVPIGRPISNTQIYILDSHLNPVPIGVQGELYIGGDGLARGYLNRPELTKEKFITNPFDKSKVKSQKSKLYKTGDLARYLPDGNIEFLGRIDNQVKIRGFRIELGEIEAVLSQHPSVAQTVVIDREDTPGEKRLVTYLVPSDQTSSQNPKSKIPNQLRDFLKQKLPDYMIPSAFVLLEALPLTPNGKIDRRALPAPDQTRLEPEENFVAPRDEVERQLTQIWGKVLGIQPIGIKDNFFNLGGHSLLAVKLFTQMEKVFKINLPLATLFQAPTIEQIASILREKEVSSPYSSLVPIQVGGSKPPLFLIAQGATTALQYVSLSRNLSPQQPVYCLQAPGIDKDLVSLPPQRLEEIAAHYLQEIQIVQPEGPYQLGGRCALGSIVAFEIAQQLLAQGEKVNLLAMLDPGVETFQGFFADYETRLARLFSPTRTPKYYVNRFLYYWQNRHFKKYIKFRVKNWKNQLTNTLDKMPGGRKITEQIVPLHVRRIATVFDGYYQAFLNYHPQLYPEKITLFICEDWLQNLPLYQNWQEVAAGGLEIHDCPGTHLTMLDEPDVQQLAAKLQACLDSASFSGLSK